MPSTTKSKKKVSKKKATKRTSKKDAEIQDLKGALELSRNTVRIEQDLSNERLRSIYNLQDKLAETKRKLAQAESDAKNFETLSEKLKARLVAALENGQELQLRLTDPKPPAAAGGGGGNPLGALAALFGGQV